MSEKLVCAIHEMNDHERNYSSNRNATLMACPAWAIRHRPASMTALRQSVVMLKGYAHFQEFRFSRVLYSLYDKHGGGGASISMSAMRPCHSVAATIEPDFNL